MGKGFVLQSPHHGKRIRRGGCRKQRPYGLDIS